MSEAMTNSEIEDVLSSIRRLVAQEARPAPERVPERAPDRAPERLVLTPEQRVAQANLTVAPEPVPAPAAEPPAVDRAGLEAAISELEAVLGPAPRPEPVPESGSESAPRAAPAPEAAAEMAEPEPEPDFALIDEDDLQRLIARLVREELRGQLGEKITLQVRKLVRAEIARALDERNLLG